MRGSHFFRPALAITVCLFLAYSYAKLMVQWNWAWYDDEGFMLLTLFEYVSGTPLYDALYTEYGPFYYVLAGTVFDLSGLPVTHDSVRWFTIVSWLAVAVGWSAFVWVWSGSLRLCLTALLATVIVLRTLNGEPGHPQLLVLLLILTVLAGATLRGRLPGWVVFTLIGGANAGLLLTKINIGLFVSIALAVVFAAFLNSAKARVFYAIIAAGSIGAPAALMHSHLREPAVLLQCAIYTYGIAMFLYALRSRASPEIEWREGGWALVGMAVVVLVTIATVILKGTTLAGLSEGVILQPLRFSRAVPFQARDVSIPIIASLSCALSMSLLFLHAPTRESTIGTLQTPVAFGVIAIAVLHPALATAAAPGVLWILVPRSGGPIWASGFKLAAVLAIATATFGVMMAYPVSGTQTYVAASIVVLAAFAGLIDGFGIPRKSEVLIPRHRLVSKATLCNLIIFCALSVGAINLLIFYSRPRTAQRLPNSNLIHLSHERYATFAEIIDRTSRYCSVLVTVPGMNSFNIWSGIAHPNPAHITSGAMILFDAATQERLRHDFLASPRPCVISNPALESWSARYRPSRSHQPFMELTRNELVLTYSRFGYEIRVPPEQAGAWNNGGASKGRDAETDPSIH